MQIFGECGKAGRVCVWLAVCVWLTRFGRPGPRCVHVLLWWCDTRCVVSDGL